MRIRLPLILGILAMAGCSPAADNPITGNQSALQAGNWSQFRDDTIERWFELDPAFAVYQGRHEYDGRLPDWSSEGLKRRGSFLKETIRQARGFTGLDIHDRFERDYLVKVAEGALFWLEDADQPHKNPAWYVGSFDPNVYVAREYADPATRMRAMVVYLENVPAAAAAVRANLQQPLPASFIDYGVAAFGGFADYYVGDGKAAFADVADADLQRAYDAAAAPAARAMRDLRDWLAGQRDKAAQDFALGPERFQRMLKQTEGVDISIDALVKVGLADLKRNQDALAAECAKFAPDATIAECVAKMSAEKPEGGVVEAAQGQIPELRQFVIEHDLVSIPGTEEAQVRESPPYNRQNSAYIDIPGPFDKGLPSIYYISPPDPSWPAEVQRAYIPAEPDLLFTTVHEIMPGHFLQFLHANRSQSVLGQIFVGYAFAEGWAHYSEEMMWEAGLREGDPATHIGQLSNALLRNCRFLAAIGLHAQGMTQAEAQQMFQQQCYIDEGNARQQAARGTYDPAFLNYTMGKLMIRKLRADWTARNGGRKAWKAFHDQFLSYGGPPIPLVRQAMMGDPSPRAVF
ncbi:DUF885 domain-containing protein [Stakelama tenebrarum]|uniref:DUF885 domain-containing protein n=1 Tax=Stakelama tenebrarum TaxID=2711215 RepID=A0A6G6Y6N1_9SPHN|nr:DUF885 domain-containing protein [Sphingosinithalassobacter tenebrarum]QIG80604.1 DUF885 domain-containing protein [Sphingosinithalassobacter tenebrarum]